MEAALNRLNTYEIKGIIAKALLEDIGNGDITAQLTVSEDAVIKAELIAMEDGIIAGLELAAMIFTFNSILVKFCPLIKEGEMVSRGQVFGKVQGSAQAILKTERVALNFLQWLSGIATLTARFVAAVEGYPVKIYDTRKTTPTLRMLEKYGVRVGGGYNHRFGLYDGILIKENHIRAAGGIKEAVNRARIANMKIEVETETLEEVKEAVSTGVDIIMLDNMDIETMKKAVALIRESNKKILIEASGGINLGNIRKAAMIGVDRISIGAITHSHTALDISLEVVG
ncbi:nicotinate-nucleotide diphosphorylase (carboxylating) [Candidatus Desantisbacteria bacterium CG2_30_40_21]|uniref:Probable nicotinate-nucleotide pyrophosphorylase [carboxylating] n=4 Tax=unclassified Candidatus Desantisiibacteriota TaxID=3106372 RepID=A0A2M7JEJ1_9BACT|nr:MAG: nicotinate-nucleotide diphosphorylase (carboxylating) [Candidatus Desantisbacteria bacterium CG2_30_40_21]PIP41906.1 MAG: nicotinate-nucleotide diphosphorylase (carboxylating) [Candidatus Desantisbacteria bacterium CG23_combo_of_CG06-09_8_20_14_all_40_23]PIX17825.1 MAG: nicotinate-nucleotide diphosphorylase (carboxylating) [Candidatus Desantisbacteria bacterium CG_4_8_14_3_um_filter_40_12]PIY19086.1 MAG: nicotinate-nucleotide diphosphorylase (carboxylating) [Candidatus Desantisbacteria b